MSDETLPEMMLPTEDFVPVFDGIPKDFGMIVFGVPKIGKTFLGASFPNSLLLECEPGGAKYIRSRKLDISGLAQLRQAYELIKNNPGYCETIVIDSLDAVAQWIEEEICAEMGLRTILDSKKGEKHGSQWGEYSLRIMGFLAAWRSLGKRVIFLAHTKRAEMNGDGLVINPKTINLYGQSASRVVSIIDNIGHMYAVDNGGKVSRVLSFSPGVAVEAGSRHPALSGKVINLPEGNPYPAFEALFQPKKDEPAVALTNGNQDTKAAKKELAAAGRK